MAEKANSLQAVLDQALRNARVEEVSVPPREEPQARAAPRAPRNPARSAASEAANIEQPKRTRRRPGREDTRYVGTHVPPEVHRQLKLISVEDDIEIQDLVAEALRLLFIKKGKAKAAALIPE